MSSRRLQMEFATLQTNPVPGFAVSLVNDNMREWNVTMTGNKGTPYDGGVFHIKVEFSTDYPFKAPKVRFATRIYHPNIDYESGDICLDISRENNWKPTIKMTDIIQEIASLMESPNLDTPLIASAAELFRSNPKEYQKKAKDWTKRYAQLA
ncbi:hypothetical protein H4R34_005021 [Dimargaris verticillata]|uniref:E2 ubiquitin-conjugating enzyme n=1 Tax=Dimargaris verticillata TaxID=2761393 RepID=A0A9W8EAM2_9FUNG|nr:hypothetical protein H4R34_005021 [Dimargaris verticillata]